ncbi:C39 family peptidase [Patescibacteria group bacterium]|nr:C39 family peptidase [Patescibacteria group bacterium]MBU1922260.1 C39 family peptidase [Patescibacteria group bacterium]
MIGLKPFKQSKGYCGPASLKMVLSAYGINKSENYLAKLTKSSRRKGCDEKNILKAAEKLGFRGYVKQNSSIKELRNLVKKGIPVIVDWFSPEEAGHYSIVVGFEKDKIILADPHFGKIKKHKIKWFKERWFDLPFRPKGPVLKEIIVIHRYDSKN